MITFYAKYNFLNKDCTDWLNLGAHPKQGKHSDQSLHGASCPLEPHFLSCLRIFHMQQWLEPNFLPLSSLNLPQFFPPHFGHFLLQHAAFPELSPKMLLNFSQVSWIRWSIKWTGMKCLKNIHNQNSFINWMHKIFLRCMYHYI